MQQGNLEVNGAVKLFEDAGAIRSGHFVYKSGRHGGHYVAKDLIYTRPQILSTLCYGLASAHAPYNRVVAVVGPAVGGVPLSQWVAYHMTEFEHRPILSLFAEKTEGGDNSFELRRGYGELVRDAPCLVVEDVLTTGGSAAGVVRAVRAAGGEVVAVVALWNRGRVSAEDVGGVPLLSCLVEQPIDSWSAEECPLCKQGVPVNTQFGHGAAFLASKKS